MYWILSRIFILFLIIDVIDDLRKSRSTRGFVQTYSMTAQISRACLAFSTAESGPACRCGYCSGTFSSSHGTQDAKSGPNSQYSGGREQTALQLCWNVRIQMKRKKVWNECVCTSMIGKFMSLGTTGLEENEHKLRNEFVHLKHGAYENKRYQGARELTFTVENFLRLHLHDHTTMDVSTSCTI